MKRLVKQWGALALVAAVAAPLAAHAQERGRTDGPEGSEYGKGGYADPSGGRFSLELNWGAAIRADLHRDGPPLFFGATASFWGDDWYQLDFSGAYLLDGERMDLLVGPRFRTYGFPVSLSAGLKAGAFLIPDVGMRFGFSPQVGLDVATGDSDRIILGLAYALDVPVGDGDITNRLYMNVGYRF
jgi:hypothetical protein